MAVIDLPAWSRFSDQLRVEWAYWADPKAWADVLLLALLPLIGSLVTLLLDLSVR